MYIKFIFTELIRDIYEQMQAVGSEEMKADVEKVRLHHYLRKNWQENAKEYWLLILTNLITDFISSLVWNFQEILQSISVEKTRLLKR